MGSKIGRDSHAGNAGLKGTFQVVDVGWRENTSDPKRVGGSMIYCHWPYSSPTLIKCLKYAKKCVGFDSKYFI